jgi:DNA-binding GntR family transcriptional regulator
VREALRILERERLVEFRARRGAVVMAPDAKELRDIYAVRSALYAILLRQLMEDRPGDLDALFEEYMPKLVKGAEESVDGYLQASFLLNLAMIDLASNRLIADLLTSISLRTLRYVRLGLAADPEMLQDSVKTWRALQRAVVKRDTEAVLEVADRRIRGSRDAAVRALAPTPRAGKRIKPSAGGRRGTAHAAPS